MKLKRMVACILALLLVVSILPMTALAADNPAGETIETTTGDIGTNNGDIGTVTAGTKVETNEGTITTVQERGSVITNNGNIETNNGDIATNEGWVGKASDPLTGNFGTIHTNRNIIQYNEGLVEHNQGRNTDDGSVTSIIVNAGTVTSNECVLIEGSDGMKEITLGAVGTNIGEIGTNNGLVYRNNASDSTQGVIDENRCTIFYNYGTVNTNGLQLLDPDGNAIVIDGENVYVGMINCNYGTVETNAIDGVVNNCSNEAVADYANNPSEKEPDVKKGTVTQNFGTVVDKTNPDEEKTYYGLSWGDNIQSLTLLKGNVEDGTTGINLDEYAATASRDGYRMTGYKAFERNRVKADDGWSAIVTETEITNTANHTMQAPVWLQILWEKITGTSEPQPTRTPVYTNLSADQVRVGAFLRLGNCVFKIIEVNDDSIRVATVNKLPEEALADMLGFLKQYLSDAQIAKLIGEPALLEQELVSQFFGGSDDHIAFYASRDLFANEIS